MVSSSESARRNRGCWVHPGSILRNKHVDGSCQGEAVNVVVTPCGPSMSQVQELKSETSSVGGRAAATTRSVRQRAHFCLLVLFGTERGGRPGRSTPLVDRSLEGKQVRNDCEAHPWSSEEQKGTPGERAKTTRGLMAAMMKVVDWRERRCRRPSSSSPPSSGRRRRGEGMKG